MTLQVDIYGAIVQSEQAKKEDREQLYKELEAIKSSPSAISMFSGHTCGRTYPLMLMSVCSGSPHGKRGYGSEQSQRYIMRSSIWLEAGK